MSASLAATSTGPDSDVPALDAGGLSRALLELAPNGVIVAEAGGQIVYANPQLGRMTGYAREWLVSRCLPTLISGAAESEAVASWLASPPERWLKSPQLVVSARLHCQDGLRLSTRLQLSRVLDGATPRILVFVQDLTEQERQDQLVNAIVSHDELTGLPNRGRLPDLLAALQSQSDRGALLLIDLKNFRRVNETLGHEHGDLLLMAICARMLEGLPQEAALARFSGDVLVALVPDLDRASAVAMAEGMLAAMREPLVINDWEYTQGLSIGVSLIPSDGSEISHLVRKADLALGWAKRTGGYALYDGRVAERAHRRHRLLGLLRKAIERGELRLHYQPQVDAASGRILGWEALLRWHSREAGEVSPGELIPVAEESGLILEIGAWVLRQAIAQLASWQGRGLRPGTVAVNVSTRQLQAAGFVEQVADLLHAYGVEPSQLELEITETALMADVQGARSVLAALSCMGVKLAVDDFGTGYSSLAYIRAFPLNRLKIDRSFVGDLDASTAQATIARAIIVLAHSLELSVVAEGVETEAQLAFLVGNGCEAVQGFLFTRALPVARCEQLMLDQVPFAVRETMPRASSDPCTQDKAAG